MEEPADAPDAAVSGPTKVRESPPLPWWRHRGGGPAMRALALGTLLTALLSLVVSFLTQQRVQQNIISQQNVIGNTYNTYESASGAPGQADPSAHMTTGGCEDADGSVSAGWGPDRPMFTIQHPAPYTTLDGIRDNPNIGDERGFMRISDALLDARGWSYEIEVERGHTYAIMVYVNNSAIDNSDDLEATNVTLAVNLPTCTGRRIASNAFLRSEMAFPREIWGGVTLIGAEDFNLAYVEGSARLRNNHWTGDGIPLDESIFTNNGVMLGYDSLDGRFLPGYQYAAYITFEVTPQFAPF